MDDPILTVAGGLDEVETVLAGALARGGFRVQRSLRLESACAPEGTSCPHHGVGDCGCQVGVLTVYDWRQRAHALVVHSCDGQSQVSLERSGTTVDDVAFATMLRLALEVDLT